MPRMRALDSVGRTHIYGVYDMAWKATRASPSHQLQLMAGKTGGCCSIHPVFFFID